MLTITQKNNWFAFRGISFGEFRFYLAVLTLTLGNIFVPFILHQFNLGGARFLPIYFFVMIGGYLFGTRVGLVTGLLSPVLSTFITGMPMSSVLPFVLLKSGVLGILAGESLRKTRILSIQKIILAIIGYQIIGSLFEFVVTGDVVRSARDVIVGYPGLIIQVIASLIIVFVNKHSCSKNQ